MTYSVCVDDLNAYDTQAEKRFMQLIGVGKMKKMRFLEFTDGTDIQEKIFLKSKESYLKLITK